MFHGVGEVILVWANTVTKIKIIIGIRVRTTTAIFAISERIFLFAIQEKTFNNSQTRANNEIPVISLSSQN